MRGCNLTTGDFKARWSGGTVDASDQDVRWGPANLKRGGPVDARNRDVRWGPGTWKHATGMYTGDRGLRSAVRRRMHATEKAVVTGKFWAR